ncbi:MAG: biotin/lipoyl-containing protein, partial [Oscillospiraceae bacterium]
MKRYTINVNGTSYDVTVEEADASAAPAAAAAPAPKAAPKAAAPAAAGNASVVAPMRGTIVDVKVKVGDKISNGTVIAVLEAMKMENDIVSDKEGTV